MSQFVMANPAVRAVLGVEEIIRSATYRINSVGLTMEEEALDAWEAYRRSSEVVAEEKVVWKCEKQA